MDRKKIEVKLSDWARELGFTLPDGSFPSPNLFSVLNATPHRSHLWEVIVNKVESKEKVQRVRKQILLAKVQSDEKKGKLQDCILSAHSGGIQSNVELWKKKKMLEKRLMEKRKEVDDLRSNVYLKAQLTQSEICKVAEIERLHSDLKEKLLLSTLTMEKHKEEIEKYKEQVETIKSYGKVDETEENTFEEHKLLERLNEISNALIERLGKGDFVLEEKEICHEFRKMSNWKNWKGCLWGLLLKSKIDNLKKYSTLMEPSEIGEETCDVEIQSFATLKSIQEQLMLKITENSLQAILNRRMEKEENLKMKEIVMNIEKLMFNKSVESASKVEVSYLGMNETGDSLTGRKEKMSLFFKILAFYGLKKQNEFLKREIEKLTKENQKNERWTTEKEKFEQNALFTSEKLESMKEEACQLMSQQASTAQSVIKSHNEFVSSLDGIKHEFREKNTFLTLCNSMKEIRNGTESKVELIEEACLDVFRRIQLTPGKEVFQYESFPHCLDRYGGELRDFFSSILLSPYEKPESIIKKLENRKKFLTYINEILLKGEMDLKNGQSHVLNGTANNADIVEQNNRETLRILSKVLTRLDDLKLRKDFIRKILKSWLEQPFRVMIPDGIMVNSMTLRQYEEKYRTVVSEIKYCSEINQSLAFK